MPKFPVIWLGSKCGVMHFNKIEELNTTDLMFFGPLLFEGDSIIDATGQEWGLTLNTKPQINFFQRIKALAGSHVETTVDYGFSKLSLFDLNSLKARLIKQSENDTGDLMWQFIEHDEIVEGVTSSMSITSLFQFIENKVCSET